MYLLGLLSFIAIPAVVVAVIIQNVKNNQQPNIGSQDSAAKTTKPTVRLNSKGNVGEYLISKLLSVFENNGSKILCNAYIPTSDYNITIDNANHVKTAEIDVIFIDQSGVYVIESKNYSGWIFGDETSDRWTQTFRGKRKAYKQQFYNPVMQNKAHIRHLYNLLSEKKISFSFPIHNIIVFGDDCKLMDVTVNKEEVHVIHTRKLLPFITDQRCKEPVLTNEQIQTLYDTLLPYTQVSEEVKQQHINDVKNIKRT